MIRSSWVFDEDSRRKRKSTRCEQPKGDARASIANDEMSSTSSGDAHTQHNHLGVGSGVVHRAAPPDKGHRSGAEGAEAGHHRGPRTDGGEAHSLPSGDAAACGVRSHRGHSSLGAWGRASVHDSVPGGCIHGAWGTFGRIHPWVGRAGVGSETGTGHGRDGLHGSGSGENDETGRWFLESELRGLDMSGLEAGFLTSATQVTREPLNSCPSSFSTAVLRSLAVSNSTNLVFLVNGWPREMERERERLGPWLRLEMKNLPSALFTAGLGIDHVQSRLAGKVFQVLKKAW